MLHVPYANLGRNLNCDEIFILLHLRPCLLAIVLQTDIKLDPMDSGNSLFSGNFFSLNTSPAVARQPNHHQSEVGRRQEKRQVLGSMAGKAKIKRVNKLLLYM